MGAPSLQRISALMNRQAFRHMSIRLALHAQLDDPDEQRLLKQHVVSIVLDGFGFYTSGPLIACGREDSFSPPEARGLLLTCPEGRRFLLSTPVP